MREILFRGKREENDVWIWGGFNSRDGKAYIIGMSKQGRINGIEVAPKTVGQYTGLTDKNGTKIFEGDIVKDCYGEVELCYYHEEKHRLIFDATHFIRELEVANGVECEVIGNIHDNPELLVEK